MDHATSFLPSLSSLFGSLFPQTPSLFLSPFLSGQTVSRQRTARARKRPVEEKRVLSKKKNKWNRESRKRFSRDETLS